MPKKTKNDPAISAASTEAALASLTPVSVAAARKRAASPKSASRKAGAKKKAPGRAAKKASSKLPGKRNAAAGPSDAEIRTRAYFLAERRAQLGILGDSAHDWLEAKRQLLAEGSQAHA